MDVTLVIPAYNEEKEIGACLESVLANAPGKFTEIVVIDNASTDKTGEVAAKYPGVRVVREEKKGLTNARQCGLEHTSSEYLAFIDADCRLPRAWFAFAEHHFSREPETVVLSGPVRYFDGPAYLRVIVELAEWVTMPLSYYIVGFMVIGGNFIARRDALLQAGGFNTAIDFYGEDVDIGRRLARIGHSSFFMRFFVYTSMRRFMSEGLMRTSSRYTLNFIWHIFFKKSFHTTHVDLRS